MPGLFTRKKSTPELHQILLDRMAAINNDPTMSLSQKKMTFLKEAPKQINQMYNDNIQKLFNEYNKDRKNRSTTLTHQQTDGKFAFIYLEKSYRPIGFFKKIHQTVFGGHDPIGNTNTHKAFLGLLKARVNFNIANKINKPCDPNMHYLMSQQRGRTKNRLLWMGGGLQGDFNQELSHHR